MFVKHYFIRLPLFPANLPIYTCSKSSTKCLKNIEPSDSPIVLSLKKDGSLQFCVDYRRLNAVMKKDTYSRPWTKSQWLHSVFIK